MRPILRHLFTAGLLLFTLSGFGQALNTTFAPATVTAAVGSTVSLQLKVTNFTNITSLQFPITYNSAVLQFTSISNATLPGFTAANYNASTGKVTVSWYPDLGQYPNGFTAPDNSSIFTVNFTVLANGSTPVNIANTSPGIEVTRNNNVIQVNFASGGTTVTGGSGGPGPLMGFHVLANTIHIPQGQTGCMPVTVHDFDNIVSAAWAMHWNTSVLQYQNTAAYNLPDLSASNFNPFGSGTLLMSWYDQTLNGVSRADGTKIYEVCFKATGPVGSTSMITIDGVGFPPGGGGAEVINAASQNVWTGTSGVADTIFVVTAPPPPNAVTFTADKDTVVADGTTCVDVKVTNFTDVISMQLGITYDPAKIQFQSLQFGANPLGLSNANFNPNIPGEIKFTWFDPNAVGVDLPNVPGGTTIFSVCFTAVGDTGMTSPFTFTGLPGFAIEIVKEPGGEVIPALNNGSVYITGIQAPKVVVDSVTNVACTGAATGAAFISTQNGTPTNYSWSGGMSGSPDDLMGVPANTYTVTVTFAGGATATATVNITQPASALALAAPVITNVNCFGGQDGAITVAPSGGTSPYNNFKWAGPGYAQTTTVPTVNGLKAGVYTVTVTDSKGCTVTSTASVAQPSADISVPGGQVQVTGISCFGGNNGSITITNPTGGTPPYATYSWTGPNGYTASTKSISNLDDPGNYSLLITDSKGCSKTVGPYNITAPTEPLQATQTGAVTDVTCAGANNGKASVTVTGGTPNYTIVWRLANNQTIANGPNPNSLVPGTYTVSVTDSKSCTATVTGIVVGGPTDPISIGNPTLTHVKCPGDDDGCINLTLGGGNGAPFTVTWTNTTQTGPQICDLSGGSYVPTVRDKNDCPYTFDAIVVNEPNPVAFPDSNIVEQNGVNLGSISLGNFTGGTGPFTYNWTGPNNFTSTQKDLTGLVSGIYNLTITDANGCTYLAAAEVKNANVLVNTAATVTPACNNDGCIHLTIPQGAPAPFIVKWGGNELVGTSNQISVCNLASGAYSLTITDAGGNAHTIDRVVTQLPQALVGFSLTEPFDESKNGKITLTPIPPGTVLGFSWAHDPTLLSNVLTGLDSGTYIVTVTNPISGCTNVYTFDLDRTYAPLVASTQTTGSNCLNSTEGSIVLNVQGGNDPYTYQWTGPNGYTAATKDISNLLPGTYTYVLTDYNGTTVTGSVNVTSQSNLLVTNVNELSDYSGYQVSSTAACDGEASVVFTGASGNTQIQWSNGVTGANNLTLCGGAYSVTVTDNLGCTSVWSDSLTVPPTVVSVFTVITNFNGYGVPCNGDCVGKARVTVAGGIPPYTVRWPSGQIDQITTANGFSQAEQLCGGDYTVTITDFYSSSNGLSYTFTGTVTEPDPLVIEFADVTPQTLTSCDGQIIASTPAAAGDVSFTWANKNTGANGGGERVEDLCAGHFVEFIAIDELGCISTAVHQVPYPNCLDVRPIITPGQQDGLNDYTLITCIEDFPENTFELFNRWGQLVFQLRGYKNEPTLDNFRGVGNIGVTDGRDLPEGAYFFVLKYVDDQGANQTVKGYINILR